MVRLKGLEPSRRGHQILSLARLPIPPQAHKVENENIIDLQLCILSQFIQFVNCFFESFCNPANAITHIITERSEPVAVASPIGNRVAGNSLEVRYTPGTRTSVMAMILCRKDSSDRPHAQKYPLKLK